MAKYRKKPIVIEAEQFIPGHGPPSGVKLWPDENGVQPRDMSFGYIETLEGRMHVMANDWIITGVKGEKYPCKPDIFAVTYEPAERPCPHCGTMLKQLPAWTGVGGVLCPNCGGDIRASANER